MLHSTNAERSRKPGRVLKNPNPPAEAVKTFACKISASFHRQTASARQRYCQALHQFETKFLNSSQGEAGLIYAVPNIPTNITPAELASAFNDTLTRMCNESQGIQFSSTSLSPDSAYQNDLLDFEHEKYPPTSSPPRTTSTRDLLLLELSDSSTVVESRSTSPASVDDLLCRHGLDQLQVPLLPSKQYSTAKTSDELVRPKQAPPDPFDFLKTLSFQDLNPFPLVTKAQTAVKREIVGTRVGVIDTSDKRARRQRALLRKRASNNIRQASIDNLATSTLVATPTSHPECLRPGPLNIHRAELPRLGAGPILRRTYSPSMLISSPNISYQPGPAPFLPVASTAADTLMEEITNELAKVLVAFEEKAEEEGIPEDAAPEADKLGLLPRTLQPIVPLRLSSRTARTAWDTIPQRPLSFKGCLLDASRSALLAAANEAETSELRWFHCRQ